MFILVDNQINIFNVQQVHSNSNQFSDNSTFKTRYLITLLLYAILNEFHPMERLNNKYAFFIMN